MGEIGLPVLQRSFRRCRDYGSLLTAVFAASLSGLVILLLVLVGGQPGAVGAATYDPSSWTNATALPDALPGSISGSIFAPDSVTPVTDTTVLLWAGSTAAGSSITTTTGAGGNSYTFGSVAPGIYTLQASPSSAQLVYASGPYVTVTVQAGTPASQNLTVTAMSMFGAVLDNNGAPAVHPQGDLAQSARVVIQNSDRSVSSTYSVSKLGYYRFGGLVSDTYTLQAYAPYTGSLSLLGTSSSSSVTVTPGVSQTLNLSLTVPTITGTVVTPGSYPVTRTSVSLWDDKRTIQRSVYSNDLGQFAFGPIPQGTYWLQTSNPWNPLFSQYAQSVPAQVSVFSGTTAYAGPLTVTIPSITGTVILPDTTPVSGASVSVYNSDHSVSFGVGTDSGGNFKVRQLPAGIYFVRASPPSGSSYSSSMAKRIRVSSGITAATGALTLTVPCISGRVVDPSGNPLPRSGLTYYSTDPANPVRDGASVDQTGRFNIGGLASGAYYIQANPPSGSPYISSSPISVTVVVSGGSCSPVSAGDLALRAPGMKGRVVDIGGSPVAGASLSIRKSDRSLSFGASTDSNGAFTSAPLPSGDYVVIASPPSGSDLWYSIPVTTTGIVSGTTASVGDIPLTRLGVKGRALLPDSSPAQKGSAHLYNTSRTVDKYAGLGAGGIFRFGGIDPGSYSLELTIPWEATGIVAPPAQPVTVVVSQTTNVGDISYLRAAKHIYGQVIKRAADGTTSAVAGAIVYANRDNGTAHVSEKTGSDGSFTLDTGGGAWLVGVSPDRSTGVPAPDWVNGQPPALVTFKEDTSEETKPLTLTVTAAGATVTGDIRLPDASLPAAGSVYVGIRDDSGFSAGTNVGSDGSFTLKAPGGVYHLYIHASDPSLTPPAISAFSLGSAENKDLGTITLLAKSAKIAGRVQDNSGQGISDIDVQAWLKGGGGFISTKTITDGVYSLLVISGTWEVQARPGPDSDYVLTTPPVGLAVADNQTRSASFTLLATDAVVAGKIVDSGLNVISDFQGYAYAMKDNVGMPSISMGGAPVKNGSFELNLPSGNDYRIGVVCPTGCKYTVPEARSINLASGEDRQVRLAALGADSAIAGAALDSSGNPVQHLRGTVRAASPLGLRSTDLAANGTYSMTVNSGTWRMGLWTDPNSGYVWEQRPLSTTAASGITSTVNFTVTQANSAISGTVKDPTGSPLDGAWVWAEEPGTSTTPAVFVRGDTSKNGGQYSIPLPSGRTYRIRASVTQDKGYVAPEAVVITITAPISLSQNLQFRQPDAQIQGTVSLNGSPRSAFVRAWGTKGGFATANAGEDGSYSLNVTKNDSWRVVAVSDAGGNLNRSTPVVVTVGSTSPVTQNLTLTQVGTVPTAVSVSFDATQSHVINLSDGTQVIIPGGALANSGTVSVVATPKFGVPAQKGAEPVGLGYDLQAMDSDGNSITSFLQSVTVVIKYTEAQLASLGITEDQVIAKYWDSTTSTWKTPDNVIQNKDNNTFSISTNHFTVFCGVLGSESVVTTQTTRVYLPLTPKVSGGAW